MLFRSGLRVDADQVAAAGVQRIDLAVRGHARRVRHGQLVGDDLVVLNVDQNPDGRIAGTRANGNNFDLNRDFLTQSQPETQAVVALLQEWLPPDMLDQHGYVTPTLIESTTKEIRC